MHGTLRFILAFMVALSHLGVSLPNFNQGVYAVVIFYILAGMVSYKLITKIFKKAPLAYYKNRIKRIYPFYFYALLLSFVAYSIGVNSYFLSKTPTLSDFFANISIIPLAYYMYTGVDRFTLIPPAWSLGVELQFYLLVPLLFYSKRFFYVSYALSFFVFSLAIVGYLNTDYFAYRLLVGVLFIFLIGSLINKAKNQDSNARILLQGTYVLLTVLLAVVITMHYKAQYNYEVLLALLTGIPLLYTYRSLIPKKIDKYLGNLSYGIFLLHFPALWLMQALCEGRYFVFGVLVFTLFLALLGNKITTVK